MDRESPQDSILESQKGKTFKIYVKSHEGVLSFRDHPRLKVKAEPQK
jgi:hypothetical protein